MKLDTGLKKPSAVNVASITNCSPGLLLRRLIDQEESIKHVLITVQDTDGVTQTFHTRMRNETLTWMLWAARDDVETMLRET